MGYENLYLGEREPIGSTAMDPDEEREEKLKERLSEALRKIYRWHQPPRSVDPGNAVERYKRGKKNQQEWCESFVQDLAFAPTGKKWEPVED